MQNSYLAIFSCNVYRLKFFIHYFGGGYGDWIERSKNVCQLSIIGVLNS
jgi:hypothetical protein